MVETKSALTTLMALVLLDGAEILLRIYNGDYSQAVLVALGWIVVRAAVKTIMKLLWPNLPVGLLGKGKKKNKKKKK